MNSDKYPLKASENYISFEFTSEGTNGTIHKKIIFTLIEQPNIWNLGFGDVNNLTGEIDDLIKSDNGDIDKVLATVAQSVITFTENHPESLVFAEGSTPIRTRLYRIGISQNFKEISETFLVWGLLNDEWQPFERNTDYKAFLVKRKFDF
ncbi:MAG: hypothetical protein MUF58_19985 [Arcicella sp.]|jgi:hypothetical protein|nr:hypothetical protein [Arcicella sp.]